MKQKLMLTLGCIVIVTLLVWVSLITILTWPPRLLYALSWWIEKLGINLVRLTTDKKRLRNEYKYWLRGRSMRGRHGSLFIRQLTNKKNDLGSYTIHLRGTASSPQFLAISPRFQRDFYRTKNPLFWLAKMVKVPWNVLNPIATRLVGAD